MYMLAGPSDQLSGAGLSPKQQLKFTIEH